MRADRSSERPVYPVGLLVLGQPCLVVGGGRVAARKIGGLLACGAKVTVVAPEVHEAIEILAAKESIAAVESHPLSVQLRRYRSGEAGDYRLVFAATGDPGVDAKVHEDADAAGVWVNSADDAEHCSFLLPAVMREGPVTVAVSTSGTSPAVAVWLRRRIADVLGSGIGEVAALIGEARAHLKDRGGAPRTVDWEEILAGSFPHLVAQGRLEEARAILETALEGGARPPT